ncbi:MAG: serine/threonine protein kinase [Actinobacteria bacterium]|nr:serine/threonine protein kinase [Actinomycetota bacterium]
MADPSSGPGRADRTIPLGGPSTVGDGRYVLGDVLGSGGMGVVRRAVDEVLGRNVAVKLLADNLSLDPEARERFAREAQAAARLTHPNVVQVFDVGEEDGRPYFVMELVPGPSLGDVIRETGPMSAAEVEAAATHTLRGLARAHAAGLLHRDLKPGNLLRSPDGTVKVTDFGVAQAAELPGMTRTGLVLGTLPYLAPERLAGAPATVASDLYGLGATLLELLTGVSPDVQLGASRDTPWQQLDTVPPHLAGLIRSCLARDPADRPASAQEALAILEGDLPPPEAPAPGPATEVLPVEGHAPTVAVSAGSPSGATTVDDPAAPPAPAAAAGHPQPLRARGWVRWVVLLGLALLLLLALSSLLRGGDGVPADGDVPPADAPADPDGVPAGDTPAETARNLAEWLRSRGR